MIEYISSGYLYYTLYHYKINLTKLSIISVEHELK